MPTIDRPINIPTPMKMYILGLKHFYSIKSFENVLS